MDDTLHQIAHVWLGNPAVIEVVPVRNPDGTPMVDDKGREVKERRPVPHGTWTVVGRIPGHPTKQLIRDIANPGGLWENHSDAPGPSWIASDDPALAAVLAAVFECPVVDIPADA